MASLGVTSLRPATVADAALIARLHAASRASAYRGMLPDAYLDQQVHAEAAAHWPVKLQQLSAGAGEVLIAERNGQLIGFICLMAPDGQNSVFVDNLHAAPQHKGSGVGTVLLDAAWQWARRRGAGGMHLFVLASNLKAIGFYESRGWRLQSREDHQMAGIDVVALRYSLSLASADTEKGTRR